MSDPKLFAEGLLKRLEDDVQGIREQFERGLSARNTGARVVELDAWRQVREGVNDAQVSLAEFRIQVP